MSAVNALDKLESLLEMEWESICRHIYLIVGDWQEAEDLALETFERYSGNPPRKKDNIRGWLYRVATNLGFNSLRSKKRRDNYESRYYELSQNPDPESEVNSSLEGQYVRKILGIMKPKQAKLLLLRYSGFKYTEIAEILGIRPSSIGKMLSRAEDKFEKLYRQQHGG